MSPLPIVKEAPVMRRSRSSKWRAGVLILVQLLIAAHITHWLVTGNTLSPLEPSEAMEFSKSGVVNAGLIFLAATLLLTMVFGRFVCGWACHLVALQDLSRWILQRLGRRPKELNSRVLRWVPALAFFYMFLWPVAYRLWIRDSFSRHGVELQTGAFWDTFPGWTLGILTFLICGFVIVYFLGAKGFCTYACPYGAAYGLAERFSPMRIRVTDACRGCGHCTASCTSGVRVHEQVRDFGMVVDSGCMKTLDCVSVCPNGALFYGPGSLGIGAKPRVDHPAGRRFPLHWWEEAVLAAGFAAAFFTFRGLYGVVPFLMALGLSAILAYLTLLTVQVATRPNLSLKSLVLKRAGRVRRSGWGFLGFMLILAIFWVHSAVVRYETYLSDWAFLETAPIRGQVLDTTGEAWQPSVADQALIIRTRDHLERVRDLGWMATSGNVAKRAWMHYLAGSAADLEESAMEALDRGEWVMEMHLLLAKDAWSRRELARAVNELEQAIAFDPELLAPHLNLGLVLAEAGDLIGAERVFERATTYFPDSTHLMFNAGLARALRGDTEGAIRRFERVLEIAPSHVAARENLAGILASVGRFEESAEHFRSALEESPEDAETLYLFARVLAALGERDEALEALGRALEVEPEMHKAIILRQDLAGSGRD